MTPLSAPPWLAITRDIVCRSPVDGLAQFDAAFVAAAAVDDVASQLALSANTLCFMLFHWTRFDGWRGWIERIEAANAALPEGEASVPELTRLSGALAAALLRGDSIDALAPLGHAMESLMHNDAEPIQLYLAAATVLPWLQMSHNVAAAQALHARMRAIDGATIAGNNDDSAHYFRGAWLYAWAHHLFFVDRPRFAAAMQAFDALMLASPTPLLRFRHARLTTERHVLQQDMPTAELGLNSMLAALHHNRPMERVIYNSVASLVAGVSGDADRMQLHAGHIARDLLAADCPPALATIYHMAEARAHLASRRYDLAARAYDACVHNAHSVHADVYRGAAALARVLTLNRHDASTLGELRHGLATGLAAMRKQSQGSFFAVSEPARGSACALALRENIEADFVRAVLARHPTLPPDWADEHWPWALTVRAFGGFRALGLIDEGRAASKASNRPVSLLKLIASHGRQGVTVLDAAEALWPAQDGDQAENSLSVTLLRLRKMNANAELFVRSDGWLHLDAAKVWTDVAALETHLDSLFATVAKTTTESVRLIYIARLFDLYRGDCLFGVEDDWAVTRAAHYRGRVTLATQQLLQSTLESQHTGAAQQLMTGAHSRGLDVERLFNTVHPSLRITQASVQLQHQLSLLGLRQRA